MSGEDQAAAGRLESGKAKLAVRDRKLLPHVCLDGDEKRRSKES